MGCLKAAGAVQQMLTVDSAEAAQRAVNEEHPV